MRGSWSKKCLENFGRRVVDRAETIDGVAAGRELGQWVNDLLRVADVSLRFLLSILVRSVDL